MRSAGEPSSVPVRRATALGLAFAILAAGGCRQVLGIEHRTEAPPDTGDAGDDAAPACGSIGSADSACGACTNANCCDQATACRADAVCGPTFDCAEKCDGSDDLCRANCVITHSDAMAALASCQATSCASECHLGCGGILGLFEASLTAAHSKACADCAASAPALCNANAKCAKDVRCVELAACIADCNPIDYPCVDNCFPAHADGDGLLLPVRDAFTSTCNAACRRGSDWSCVGHVEWPQGSATTISYRYKMLDYDSKKPAVGATVRACGASDPDCSHPYDTQTSDQKGWVTLTAPVLGLFDGYTEMTGAGYYPTLVYHYPPFAQSLTGDDVAYLGQDLLSNATTQLLVSTTGATIDPARSILYIVNVDCQAALSPGVSFSVDTADGSTTPFYVIGTLPGTTAKQTDSGGAGGFVNLPAGPFTLTVSLPSDAGATTVARVSAWARKGALNVVYTVPTP